MKNIVKNISVLLLLFNCFTITAQTQQEQLLGTWTFDFESSKANMEEKAKTVLQKMPSAKEKLEKAYKNRQITFGSDGSYLLRLADGSQIKGTWTVNNTAQSNSITITASQNQIQHLVIIMLSDNTLILKQEDTKGTPMFSKWYFTKI